MYSPLLERKRNKARVLSILLVRFPFHNYKDGIEFDSQNFSPTLRAKL